jgi:hypothetical protein
MMPLKDLRYLSQLNFDPPKNRTRPSAGFWNFLCGDVPAGAARLKFVLHRREEARRKRDEILYRI